jgi:hypothetical protein
MVASACVAALRESRACTKTHALPYLLVLSEDEKSDWFKMKNMLIYAKFIQTRRISGCIIERRFFEFCIQKSLILKATIYG